MLNLHASCFGQEGITRDSNGRLLRNGKVMTEAAIDQRLRRWCTRKKGGGLKCPQEIFDQYHSKGDNAREDLKLVYKDNLLNKDGIVEAVFNGHSNCVGGDDPHRSNSRDRRGFQSYEGGSWVVHGASHEGGLEDD